MKTLKDYPTTTKKISWAVITPQNVVMAAGFVCKQDAEHFRENGYGGYYSECTVRMVRTY